MDGQDLAFSVLLPTYKNDDAEEMEEALNSLLKQTHRPDEVLIIKDGPVSSSIDESIDTFERDNPSIINSVQLPSNQGLGNALRVGVEEASHSLIARMDADDISVSDRFERQTNFLATHPEVDIVGGQIDEFESDPKNIVGRREVPTDHEAIESMARFRSPMNHGTVLFRKSTVIRSGNYRPVDRMEDYDLWVRMLLDGAKFANLPEVLVKVRAGESLYGRRGGVEYAREEARTQIEFYRRGFTSLPVFAFNTVTRVGLRLVPNSIRSRIYRTLAR